RPVGQGGLTRIDELLMDDPAVVGNRGPTLGGGVADRIGRGVKRPGNGGGGPVHAGHVVSGEDDLGAHRVRGVLGLFNACRRCPAVGRVVVPAVLFVGSGGVFLVGLVGLCGCRRGAGGVGIVGVVGGVAAGGQPQGGGQYQGGEGNAAFHERSFQRWCELGVERQGQSVTVTGDIEPLCSSFPSVGARRAGSDRKST